MNKYCLVISASPFYLLGLNSILNAFAYYKNTDTDIVVVRPKSMIRYVEYAASKFPFPVIAADVYEWGDPNMVYGNTNVWDENMNMIWAEFNYMLSIKDKYEAIAFMDADELLLGNIMPYFKIAAGTDLFLVPHNNRCGAWYTDFERFAKPEDLARGFPIQHWFACYNPKHHSDVIQYLWDNRFSNEMLPVEKREPQEEQFVMNMAFYKLNKIDKVFELPGSLWLNEEVVPHRTGFCINSYNGLKVVSSMGDRVMGMHCRFWNKPIMESAVGYASSDPVNYERVKREKANGEKIIDFFNKGDGAIVKLSEIYNLDTNYIGPINSYEKY